MQKLEKGKYMHMLEVNIRAASLVAKLMTHNQMNVLIHCPTGEGASVAISSLSQIMLDPYYRTLDGFKALINKEWHYFNHDFITNNALYRKLGDDSPPLLTPFFIIFMDLVHQIQRQNPTKFEFTSKLLKYLAFNVFTNKFAEFTYSGDEPAN